MYPLVLCLLIGLILVTGSGPVEAQVPDDRCAAAPTTDCVLALAAVAAQSEIGPGDREVALMRVSHAYASLGDAEAIAVILASMNSGERADLVRGDLARVRATRGDALGAFDAAASMQTGWRRDTVFAEIAGLLAAQGRGATLAEWGADGPVRRGLLAAALGIGDLVQADALLAAMDATDRAWFLPDVVAAHHAAGDAAGASRLAGGVAAGGDTLDTLRLFVADQQTEAAAALLRRLAAGDEPIADAIALVLSGPAGDAYADLAQELAADDPEALGLAGQFLAENEHVVPARQVAERLAELHARHGDATAAEARLRVLWAIVDAHERAGDVEGALAGLTAIQGAAYTPLDNPFPDPVPRRRVEILMSAGRTAEAHAALAHVWDPFERASAMIALARSEETDATADTDLLAEAAAVVREVREVPSGFGGTLDASVPVIRQLSAIAGAATELELETASALAAETLSRILTLPEAGTRALRLAELAVALAPQ